MPKSRIIDLEQLILDYAHQHHKVNVKPSLKKRYDSDDFTWKKLSTFINTSGLEIEQGEAEFSQITSKEPKKDVVFKTEYSNDTANDMSYKISTTRTTRTSDTLKITQGFTFGLSFDLKIGPPNVGAGIGLGATGEFRFDKSDETTREQEVSWTIETTVDVPPHTSKIVSLVVKEDEHSGSFRVKTCFSGKILVDIRKDHILLSQVYIEDLKKLFKVEDGFMTDSDKIIFETKGIYHHRHGFEQKFEVVEETREETTSVLEDN